MRFSTSLVRGDFFFLLCVLVFLREVVTVGPSVVTHSTKSAISNSGHKKKADQLNMVISRPYIRHLQLRMGGQGQSCGIDSVSAFQRDGRTEGPTDR